MSTDKMHLAVWRDCEACNGSGTIRPMDSIGIDAYTGKRITRVQCVACQGQGKLPTFIPLDRLLDTGVAMPSLCAIRDYAEPAADLDASGPVSEIPGPGREGYADGRDHLTVSGTFQSDKYKWCPAGFVPLKLTDPAARDLLAIYAVRREPIDKEFPRDLIEALANVPEKPNPKYGPLPPLQSTPSVDLREAARRLLDVGMRHHSAEQMHEAGAALEAALDASPAQTSPDAVQAQDKAVVSCLRCCGTGHALYWNGSQPCMECNGSGVQQEGNQA